MWLTGFDAPSMHTMYVDKLMKGHGLMQAIARVNRVFRDKPAGLIVDYIGIAQNLKSALAQYSPRDKENTGMTRCRPSLRCRSATKWCATMYHGFDYRTALGGTPQQRLVMMAGAIEWILDKQQQWAAAETTEEGKKAQRRYQDTVLALSTAYALASATDGSTCRSRGGRFFQAIRESWPKAPRAPVSVRRSATWPSARLSAAR